MSRSSGLPRRDRAAHPSSHELTAPYQLLRFIELFDEWVELEVPASGSWVDGEVVVCVFWIDETAHTVRCDRHRDPELADLT